MKNLGARRANQPCVAALLISWSLGFGQYGTNVNAADIDIKADGQLAAIAMSPSGSHLAVASTPEAGVPTHLDVWDLSSGKGIKIKLDQRSERARTNLFFSPDQKRLVVCGNDHIQSIELLGGKLGTKLQNEALLRSVNGWILTLHKKAPLQLRLYDANTLDLLHSLECPPELSTLDAESSNNFAIAWDHSAIAYSYNTTIQVLDFPGKTERKKLKVTDPVDGIALSSDGKRLAAVGKNKMFPIFEWKDIAQAPLQLATPIVNQNTLSTSSLYPIYSLSFLNSESLCVSTPGTTGLWSVTHNKFTDVVPTSGAKGRARVAIADGFCTLNHLAVRLNGDQKLEVLTNPHRKLKEFNDQPYGKVNFVHSSDGELMAYAVDNSTVAVRGIEKADEQLVRVASAKHTAKLNGKPRFLFSDDSKSIAVGQDCNLKLQAIYDTGSGDEFPAELPFFVRNGGDIHSRNLNVKGPNVNSTPGPLSAAYLDSTAKEISFLGIMQWQGKRPRALSPFEELMYIQPIWFRIPFEGGPAKVDKFKPSKDIWLRLIGNTSGAFRLKDGRRAMVLETELKAENFRTPTGYSRLALMDLETGETIRVLTNELKFLGIKGGSPGENGSFVVSPDGSIVVVPVAERRLRIWNLESGKEVDNPYQYDGRLTFSGSGRYLCVVKERLPIVIFDLMTNQAINPVPISEDGFDYLVEICPTHERYLAQNLNGLLAWRNLLDGTLISRPPSHSSRLLGGSFSTDGSLLATLSEDRELRFWRVPSPVQGDVKNVTTIGPLAPAQR